MNGDRSSSLSRVSSCILILSMHTFLASVSQSATLPATRAATTRTQPAASSQPAGEKPSPLQAFVHSLSVENITLYSASPIPEKTKLLLNQVQRKIGKSVFYDASDKFSIFVCNNRTLYGILAPGSPNSFAVAQQLVKWIIVADADLDKNICRSTAAHYNERSFTGVATHEIGHIMMGRRIGVVTLLTKVPTWLEEGYCDFLAGESSFPEGEGDRLIASSQPAAFGSLRYLTYRRMVEYLIVAKQSDIEELMRKPPDEQQVLMETREWLREKLETEKGFSSSQSAP